MNRHILTHHLNVPTADEHFNIDRHSQADMAVMAVDQIHSCDSWLQKNKRNLVGLEPWGPHMPWKETSGLILQEACLNTICGPHGFEVPHWQLEVMTLSSEKTNNN